MRENNILLARHMNVFWEVVAKNDKFVLTEEEAHPGKSKMYLNVTITFCTLAEAKAYINERIKSKKVCWCKDEPLGHPMFEDCLDN